MSVANPYAAPQSAVGAPPSGATTAGGSLERGIAGDYDFEIGAVLSEAWQKTSGMKLPVWGALIVMYAIMLAILFGLGMAVRPLVGSSSAAAIAFQGVAQLVIMVLIYPVMAGIMMMGARHVAGLPVSFSTAFDYFGVTATLFIAALLTGILGTIGIVLLVIPGIYLMVSYMLVTPLIADKKLGAWRAMEASRKAVTAHWFKIFFLLVVAWVILMVSAIPLGIGLIWTVPMMINVLGVLYRDAFGVGAT